LVSALSRGVIVPTLAPFGEDGDIVKHAITDQARRLAGIDGIVGIAVNTAPRERNALTTAERADVIRETRAGLGPDQLLLAPVGELGDESHDDVVACKATGADAVICFLSKVQADDQEGASKDHYEALADLADRLPLPVIVALGLDEQSRSAMSNEIVGLVQNCSNVIGFAFGADDSVLHYDQDYYALKSVDRPLACLTTSEGALFHNLNTGADGVMSPLAQLAPHEVAALYQASRAGRFFDAQALHNRLSPLIGLLVCHDGNTRELICREVAHHRGLLASPATRGIDDPLCTDLKRRAHQVIDDIGLKPISWV